MLTPTQLKVWLEAVVRPELAKECSKDEHLGVLAAGIEKGGLEQALAAYVVSVLYRLAEYDDYEPLPERMEDMTEPQLAEHLNRQLRFIKGSQTEDTIGSMLIVFQQDGITQCGATVDPETAPDALRELADRIERRETVKR